ncbi:molecular chaperone HtpG [Chitinophaga sedimenti]|uniref:molecular chaperone HtpG n=1 Tax=Chitinophaga sedimenti TaxID=2033606 RepID=UPI002003EF7D|nr:molecular chaperone HtpG [Chitinophaga sedimenti]MCK7559574.1 molecular chaperone HtpG [Chitinophaga sedimenti]
MQKGAIRVQTENIFPIIKKFLYSDHEIFIRELVSNAVDATQKLKTLASVGEFKGETGEVAIEVTVDKENKKITISDRGIGMTAEEVDKYINQVAFSGAEEFVNKYKDRGTGANIIGHFGLGFYSSFMISDKVEIISQSWKEAPAVRWECDGSPAYELEETTREAGRGTDIVMHVNDDSLEFLEDGRIRSILEKFCRFLPIPINFHGEQINNPNPAWTKKPSELTTEDYQNFYKELYPYAEPPLFWIHLNVDYPFNLTGILYFPTIKKTYEMQKDKINLYSNQVYVTDEVKDIVPEFLMLLHGVIDSPDIPLNVSRSYLQGDPNVRKINAHITKKVADKLDEMFRNDRKAFEEKWEHTGLFVKYGMMTEDKFYEKANKFMVMEDVDGGTFYTLEELRTETQALQTNKEGKLVILYTTNPVQQDSYIWGAKSKGYKVIKLESLVDAAFINTIEQKWENVQFTRVDSDIADNLIDAGENKESVLTEDQQTKLQTLFSEELKAQPNIKVDLKGLAVDAQPVIVTRSEFMRRMKDMAAIGGQANSWYAQLPDEITMTVNANHPIYQDILKTDDPHRQNKVVRNLADLALLSQNLLTGADLTAFVHRSVELLKV